MTQQTKCPSAEQWQDLLDDLVPEAEQAELHDHLEQCPCCRELLGGLAVGEVSWDDFARRLVRHGHGPAPETALARVLSAVKLAVVIPTTHGESGPPQDVVLSFLTPSDNSHHLGRLGPYEIIEVIGCGGMGVVLKGHDPRLNRYVAVKALTPQFAASATARARFRREGQAAAAVTHDHVIAIHAVDETNGLPYLVMEYVAGRSLEQRLEQTGPLELKEILRIGMQTADGLAAAHAQGLVHRDIKPANILLENGVERVKITDFGLARAVDDVRITKPGVVTGTPEYMSPEQARGECVDHRSDLFSLGCVLYAMCAGRPPFRAESTMAIIRRVCEDTPRPLAEINPEIPQWLGDVIDRLIAKDATERFQSAAELAELLGKFLAHVQQPAVNPKPALNLRERGSRPAGERGASAARGALLSRRCLTATAAATLLLFAGLSLAETTGVTNVTATVIRMAVGNGTLVIEIDDPNIQVLLEGEEIVITGVGPKEIRLRPGQHKLYAVRDGKPPELILVTITRNGRQVVKVAREQPAPISPTTRLVWADAADTSGGPPVGRYLPFIDWDTGDVAVRDLATSKNRRVTNNGSWSESSGFALCPRLSNDGMQIAYTWFERDKEGLGRGMSLRVVQLEGGDSRIVYSTDRAKPETCGWTPDGKSILVHLQGRNQLVLIATADGSLRIVKEFDEDGNNNRRFAFAPDGRSIAYSRVVDPQSFNRDIFMIDVESGQETPVTTHMADENLLGWTPDGTRLLYDMERQGARDAWTIRVVRGRPEGESQLVKKDIGEIMPLGFTREGTFYYGSRSQGPSLFTATLDLEKGTATATPLAAEKFNIMDPLTLGDWSPDGEYLAYKIAYSTEIRIISMKTGKMRVLQPDLKNFDWFRWSPDGHSFATVALKEWKERGRNRLGIYQIDSVTGNVTTIVEPAEQSSPPHGACEWSRDGRGIIYVKYPNEIVYRDLQTQTERQLLTPGNPVFKGRLDFWFDPSPDESQLALLGNNGQAMVLSLIPVDGGASRELFKVSAPQVFGGGVGWTPDGRFVLFTQRGGDEKERGLWYVSANGGAPRKLILSGVDAKYVTRIAIHPDGRQLALSGTVAETGKSEIWAMENFLPAPTTAP